MSQGLSVACILVWKAHWCRKEQSIFACSRESTLMVQYKVEGTLAASDVNGCIILLLIFFSNLDSFFWSVNALSLQLTLLHIT